jgi:hypothetical protein
MKFHMSKILRFWVDVEYERIKLDNANRTRLQLLGQILRRFEKAGDAMRYLDAEGRVAWKATSKMLTRLANSEREAEDDLANGPDASGDLAGICISDEFLTRCNYLQLERLNHDNLRHSPSHIRRQHCVRTCTGSATSGSSVRPAGAATRPCGVVGGGGTGNRPSSPGSVLAAVGSIVLQGPLRSDHRLHSGPGHGRQTDAE